MAAGRPSSQVIHSERLMKPAKLQGKPDTGITALYYKTGKQPGGQILGVLTLDGGGFPSYKAASPLPQQCLAQKDVPFFTEATFSLLHM